MIEESTSELLDNAKSVIDNYNLDPDAELAIGSLMAYATMMKSDLLWAYQMVDGIRDEVDMPRAVRQHMEGWLDHYRTVYE